MSAALSEHKKELGPEFLYADDLLRDGKWVEATLTIERIAEPGSLRGANGQTVDDISLGFAKTKKWLVLNKTNKRLLRIETGSSKPDGWIGRQVTIYPATINAFGEKNVPCIRFRVTGGKPVPFGARKFLGKDLTA